ncbi:antitoxin MazE-like protein [Bosea sp. CCNWYY174]|uniref:antitoxin MazE-like protein n=2 Tax=Bosea TaxID=85413 RepID=UPI0030DBFA0B
MAAVAERMRDMRRRRREQNLREVRLLVPDARSPAVRARIVRQVARLDLAAEDDALRWIESVSEFDSPARDD